jgi:hypothetical protein
MISVIGDMLIVGVEVTIALLGSGVTMLVCALLCLKQLQFFLPSETNVFSCYMQLQLIIRHGEKSHHTLILNGSPFQNCYHHVYNYTRC